MSASRRTWTMKLCSAALASLLVACVPGGAEGGGNTPVTVPLLLGDAPEVPRLRDTAIQRGAGLYQQYCASCHGQDLSGQPNWRTPRSDGSYPAPPHDESGHTWHHSDRALLTMTRDGIDFAQSSMPTFGDQLTDEEIVAIIEFLKSNWSDEARAFQWQVTWQDGPLSD